MHNRRMLPRSDLYSAVRRIGAVATWLASGLLWLLVVWLGPGLHLGDDAGSRSAQSAVLIAAGSIGAAAVLAILAVLGIVLQVLARYSWAVIRDVLPAWFGPILVFALVAGVVIPLWTSLGPTALASTIAFGCFGWAMMALGFLGKSVAKRMSPSSLAVRTRLRALGVLSAAHHDRGELDELAELLRQLIAEDAPLWGDGQRTVGVYALLIAALSRVSGRGAAVDATRALAGQADGSANLESGADGTGIVRALWVLALDQVDDAMMFTETHRALTTIAANARARAQHELAKLALAALAAATTARICALEPRVGFTVPRAPDEVRVLPSGPRESEVFGTQHPAQGRPASSLAPRPEAEPTRVEATRNSRRTCLSEFLDQFGDADNCTPETAVLLLQTLHGGLGARRPAARRLGSQAHDLLRNTVDSLVGLLPPPLPSSTGWPSAWAGTQAFENDIARLAGLVEEVYLESREVSADFVEAAIELVCLRLLGEQTLDASLPPPRTLWREPPSRREEGGIAGPAADALARLMIAAYHAGFDRRALKTGLRLIALATASVQRNDLTALRAYANGLGKFTIEGIRNGPDGLAASANARAQAILTGLVAECDQLLEAAYRNGHSGIRQVVEQITQSLVWTTPPRRAAPVAAALLQVRAMAAGWPVDLPSGQSWSGLSVPPGLGPAAPLPLQVLREIKAGFLDADFPDQHSMALALTLWAQAVLAARRNDLSAVADIEGFLRAKIGDDPGSCRERTAEIPRAFDRPGPPAQITGRALRRVVHAAIDWCEKGDLEVQPRVPGDRKAATVPETAKLLLAGGSLSDWTYSGSRGSGGPGLVMVESADGSRRVLRNADLLADDFSWGYSGGGPHAMAEALVRDLLGERLACPTCMGAITVVAHTITCLPCETSGERRGAMEAVAALVDSVISTLPNDFRMSRREFLQALADGQDHEGR